MSKGKYKMYENLVFLTQIGLMLALPIFIGVYIGNYLDKKLGTGSVFLLIFIGIGVASAFLNFYKITIKRIDKRK